MEVFILIKTSFDDDYNFTHCNLGVYTKEAKDALEKVKNIDGRFETYGHDVMVVIDYAHTPDAFENILKTVNLQKDIYY